MAEIRVGMSGWTFAPWRGKFYPKGTPVKRELAFASARVSSIEINGTFYSLQKPKTFRHWHDQVPADFRFAVKGGKYITHVRRLKDVKTPLANFFASGILCLGEKLGPILWQFPPNVTLKDDRFEKFLKLLPYSSAAASRLARGHSDFMDGWASTEAGAKLPIRHAMEFRHPSFCNKDFLEMLREYGVAVVFAHAGRKSPYLEDVTADFVYARLHGEDRRFRQGYTDEVLDWWARRLRIWTSGGEPRDADKVTSTKVPKIARDAFVYFDNEAKLHAPADAMRLLEKLGAAGGLSKAS